MSAPSKGRVHWGLWVGHFYSHLEVGPTSLGLHLLAKTQSYSQAKLQWSLENVVQLCSQEKEKETWGIANSLFHIPSL